jgi:hypothetical protein
VKEVDAVRDILSRLTGASFQVTNTPDDFQNQSLHPIWFVKCTDPAQARTVPHVNEAWKQQDSSIWLESIPLGDTIEWIEVAYGDEAAARSLDVNYSDFATKEFQAKFGRDYPLVYQRIQTYAEVASRVSKARKVSIELRNSGSKGIVVFTFVTKISDPKSKMLSKKITAAVEAMKDAYAQAMQV